MYLVEEVKEASAARQKAADGPPFGPGFAKEVVDKTTRMEVWGSGADEGYTDFCLFKAFDAAGDVIAERKVGGY